MHLVYQQTIVEAGRYNGEVRMQLEYKDVCGPFFGFLHIDPETLSAHAAAQGWNCRVLLNEDNGDYLAQLTRKK